MELFHYIKSRFWEPAGPGRYCGMDTLRGLCCILMAGFHLTYALVTYHGAAPVLLATPWAFALQRISSCGFILLSGMSCRLSHSNGKRGLFTLACALLLTGVSFLWNDPIRFGILHFLGAACLLYPLVSPLLHRLPPAPAAIALLAAYLLAGQHFPAAVTTPYLFPLGLVAPTFTSSDYYPLLPFFFLFLIGSCLMALLEQDRAEPLRRRFLENFRIPLIEDFGRNALLFYVLHQPLIIALLALIYR